jgi:hypothetical protein
MTSSRFRRGRTDRLTSLCALRMLALNHWTESRSPCISKRTNGINFPQSVFKKTVERLIVGASSVSSRCRSSLHCSTTAAHSPCLSADTASATPASVPPPSVVGAPQTLSCHPSAAPEPAGTTDAPPPTPPVCLDTSHPPTPSVSPCTLLPCAQTPAAHQPGPRPRLPSLPHSAPSPSYPPAEGACVR